MTRQDRRLDEVLTGLRPPQPPPELRARTLAEARRAAATRHTEDVWTRAWSSRPLRLAWVAATALLIAAHLWLPVGQGGIERGVGLALDARHDGLDPELVDIVDLPRIDPDFTVGLP